MRKQSFILIALVQCICIPPLSVPCCTGIAGAHETGVYPTFSTVLHVTCRAWETAFHCPWTLC